MRKSGDIIIGADIRDSKRRVILAVRQIFERKIATSLIHIYGTCGGLDVNAVDSRILT